jgi:hypothetical protein
LGTLWGCGWRCSHVIIGTVGVTIAITSAHVIIGTAAFTSAHVTIIISRDDVSVIFTNDVFIIGEDVIGIISTDTFFGPSKILRALMLFLRHFLVPLVSREEKIVMHRSANHLLPQLI